MCIRDSANDGVSAQAKESLVQEGFNVTTDHVPQDQLQDYLNKEKVDVLLVRSATKVRQDLIDACPVSYTHLRAHETVLDLVCRLLLEKTTH